MKSFGTRMCSKSKTRMNLKDHLTRKPIVKDPLDFLYEEIDEKVM